MLKGQALPEKCLFSLLIKGLYECAPACSEQIGRMERGKKKAYLDENESMELVSDEYLMHQSHHGKPGRFVSENRWHC